LPVRPKTEGGIKSLASQAPRQQAAASEELADVQIYALRLADKLDINLDDAISKKIDKNRLRYTVNAAKGNATKR